MTLDQMVILWTARMALACMLVRLALSVRRKSRVPTRQECIVWTLGCSVFVLHVAAAFELKHGWSHADAYRHTAAQTAAVTGWNWGGGLFFNYLFTMLWVLDVTWDWQAFRAGQKPHPRIQAVIRGYFAFMVLNATVVFGHPGWWVVGAMLAVVLLIMRPRSTQLPIP